MVRIDNGIKGNGFLALLEYWYWGSIIRFNSLSKKGFSELKFSSLALVVFWKKRNDWFDKINLINWLTRDDLEILIN